MGTPSHQSAVVIGAGIAGLAAARALAPRFARVLVLDRDGLPDTATPRKGVPQSGHGHVLLVAGQQALEEQFPGLMAELVADGASEFDPGLDLTFHRFGATWERIPIGLRLVTFSRPLLELALRRRVARLPTVEIRDGVAASDLVGADGKVTGVVLDTGETVGADLVVDCSGRGSRSDRWLGALGFDAPTVTEVKVGVGYATRFFTRKPGDLAAGQAVFVVPSAPEESRVGLALPVEGDRWLVTVGGWHGAYPKDEAGFDEHIRSLPHPDIAGLLERCAPLGDIAYHGFPSSRRRHFEDLTSVPAGYVALGDAICSFNPIYGQGMTCATLEAVALGELLDGRAEVDAELTTAFYQRAAAVISTPWQFAVGGDFAYPQTQGPRPKGIGLLNWYSRRIQIAAQTDPEVRRTFTAVQHLIEGPEALRTPKMVWKVLFGARRATAAPDPAR
ncbi:FAD-binding monooxygenase [Longispora fulva]|uniref:2-polyprenyl-6-methoxyphenol hydroxylase-like FAD-dependent oxidoreductase n=1 Tax=Longispora fulva TaxID=619741 RepID=A0A8J7KNG5_9ACTN|nr:FAD-dependent oxidoreductase [Longispora fulva]MBG6135222.1 2-polyprenyl-6-methoxyphenol hydroxylase-like FAD-dependent oxidoreductase [Longispora fulva]GIG56544.1 FAD-binding monooxygenase [Longispora fulva]